MSTLLGIGVCAVLFILYGLLRPREDCGGVGCAACGSVCHRRPSGMEDVS